MVEVLSLLSDDVETDDAGPGENLKLRLKGIEEEEILPGFILCNAENLCHSGRTFDAQVCPHLSSQFKLGFQVSSDIDILLDTLDNRPLSITAHIRFTIRKIYDLCFYVPTTHMLMPFVCPLLFMLHHQMLGGVDRFL